MKKILLSMALMATVLTAQAQWIRVWQAGESTRYAIADVPAIPYSTVGSSLNIGGTNYYTESIDSITVVNPVTITWSGTSASVDIPASVEGVTAKTVISK